MKQKKVTRKYYVYWKQLKEATYDPVRCDKSINLRLPLAIKDRTVKAIIKEKDMDFDFKCENQHMPYRISYSHVFLDLSSKPSPHSIIILTISMSRRGDL